MDYGYFVGLGNVVVDEAIAIGDRLLGSATQVQHFYDGILRGVDHGGILAVTVKGEDQFRRGVVQDEIRVRGALDFARLLEGLQIDYHHARGFSVRDIALVQFRDQCDSVGAFQTGNRAQNVEVIRIQNFELGTVAYVDAPRLGVHGDVVEIFRAAGSLAQRNFLDQVVTARGRSCHSSNRTYYEQAEHRKLANPGNSH